MKSITVRAPAKVNLFLKVLSKRTDGYHNILTLFERISLADTIKITKIPDGIIVKSDKPITKRAKDNLVYTAAEMILRRGKVKSGVKIEIEKKIPIAAGLGGGSSDAAAVLAGMNRLFNLKLSGKALARLGGKLGADVPFFVLDAPFAVGRYRGDMLKAVKSKARFWHLLINPGFKAATKDVYKAFDALPNPSTSSGFGSEPVEEPKHLTLRQSSGSSPVVRQAHHPLNHPERSRGKRKSKGLTHDTANAKIQALSLEGRGAVRRSQRRKRFGEGGVSPFSLRLDYALAESMLRNDLEAALVSKKEIIGTILESLARLLGRKTIVSGSGPSLFCLYRTGKEAIKAREIVLKSVPEYERSDWQIFVAQTS